MDLIVAGIKNQIHMSTESHTTKSDILETPISMNQFNPMGKLPQS